MSQDQTEVKGQQQGTSSRLDAAKTALAKWDKVKGTMGHVVLYVMLVIYTAAGAKVFQELEQADEIERSGRLDRSVSEQRKLFIESVVNGSDARNFGDLVVLRLTLYETTLEDAIKKGFSPKTNTSDSYWTYRKSVFFSSTVLTTIGYGNIAPRTTGGRIFCIIFALVGIPFTLTVISDLGKLLATVVSTVWQRIKHRLPIRLSPEQRKKVGRPLIAVLAVIFLLLYIAAGGALFTLWEEWDFFEGFYFCFITMTTIGFGDIVPEKDDFMLNCMVYILIGLALTSTIIELLRRQYARSWAQMKELSNRLQGLSGPLADTLKKLGEQAGRYGDITIDVNLLKDLKDIRRTLALTSMEARKKWGNSNMPNGKDMDDSLWDDDDPDADALLDAEPEKHMPIVQIIIYESSV